jgi:NADH:ubiquinone oxidoreductase subunit C
MLTNDRVLEIARLLAEGWSWRLETRQPEPNRLDVVLSSPADLVPYVAALRVQRIGWLSAITALDLGPETDALELLYHFTHGAAVISLRLKVARRGAAVPTLTEILPGAESSEREIAEMFGVAFPGLRQVGHLYLPDGWPEATYPLLKDAVLPTAPSD